MTQDVLSIICQNNEPEFDGLIEQYLGQYVYSLIDPRDGKVFYIGKGGGDEKEAGNHRVLHHFQEAKAALQKRALNPSPKIKRIWDIWSSGRPVQWNIVRRGLPDRNTAFQVEAALIDLLGCDNLVNQQRGHNREAAGMISSEELYLKSAPPVQPKVPYKAVLMFPIQATVKERGAYDATRGWWRRTKPFEGIATHAVGLLAGVSVCVVEICQWTDGVKEGRRGFVGKAYMEKNSHELLHKSFQDMITLHRGYWQFGNWMAIELSTAGWRMLRPKGKLLQPFESKVNPVP